MPPMLKQTNFIIKKFINNKPLKRVEMEIEINLLKSFTYSKKKIKFIIDKNFKFFNYKHLFIRSLIYKFGGGKLICKCFFYKFDYSKYTLEAKHKLMQENFTTRFHSIGFEKRQILKEKRKKLSKFRGVIKLKS